MLSFWGEFFMEDVYSGMCARVSVQTRVIQTGIGDSMLKAIENLSESSSYYTHIQTQRA